MANAKMIPIRGGRGAGGALAIVPAIVEGFRFLAAREGRIAAERSCVEAQSRARAEIKAVEASEREARRRDRRFHALLRLYQQADAPDQRLRILDLLNPFSEAPCPGR